MNISDENDGVQHAAKVYHSILYTHILKRELDRAVDFVDSLVVQSNVHSKDSSGQFDQNKDKLSLMTIVTNTLKTQVIRKMIDGSGRESVLLQL